MTEQRNDITDLIPKGLGTYWLLFLGAVGSLAALEYAFLRTPVFAAKLNVETLPIFDPTAQGSLFNWFLSSLLLVCATCFLMNYYLARRHNDLPASQSAWFWGTWVLVFFSLDLQTRIREPIRDVMVQVTGTTLYHDGTAWYLAGYLFVGLFLFSRLFLVLRAYLPALFLFSVAIAAAVSGIAMSLGLVSVSRFPVSLRGVQEQVVLGTTLEGMSVICLLFGSTLFARRQMFRDPKIAMAWLAKVWNVDSAPLPNPVAASSAPQPAKPEVPVKSAAKPSVVESPKTASVSTGSAVPIRPATTLSKAANDDNDDFDLLNIV